jgi:hypothetical protein
MGPDTGYRDCHSVIKFIFDDIWNNEKMPAEYRKGIIAKLPKKRNQTACNNWRGITLL